MLFKRTKSYEDISPALDKGKLIILAKKSLPDMVFNMASLEGNTFTYTEVQTLLDGITVGGHKLTDEQQVLRITDGWNFVFKSASSDGLIINQELFNWLDVIVAKDESLISGMFRTGQVTIGGTDFLPPKAEDLEGIFQEELKILIDRSKSSIDLAFDIFLWCAINKFYYGGNKRTSRLVANLILIFNGQGIFNIKVENKSKFNTLMMDFYNNGDGDKIFQFFYKYCLER